MSDEPTFILDTIITDSTLLTSEVQTITLPAAVEGKFIVTFDGEETAEVAFNASAATLQAALLTLPQLDAGDVTVSGAGTEASPYTLTFGGNYAELDVPAVTVESKGLKDAEEEAVVPAVATTTAGGVATDAVQRGAGDADRTADTSPLAGESPAEVRAENGEDYGDA